MEKWRKFKGVPRENFRINSKKKHLGESPEESAKEIFKESMEYFVTEYVLEKNSGGFFRIFLSFFGKHPDALLRKMSEKNIY